MTRGYATDSRSLKGAHSTQAPGEDFSVSSTSFLTAWPTHEDAELKERLVSLLTYAAWYPVLSGSTYLVKHLDTRPKSEVTQPCQPLQSQRSIPSAKAGRHVLGPALGKFPRDGYRSAAGHSAATWTKHAVQSKVWNPIPQPL